MRIGNSDLNYHKKDIKLIRICPNCDKSAIETSEHFFLSCPKFQYERSVLMKKIKSSRIKTKVNMMKKILGFFEDVYCSKKKFELYKKEIKIILEASMDYISDTARFKQVQRQLVFINDNQWMEFVVYKQHIKRGHYKQVGGIQENSQIRQRARDGPQGHLIPFVGNLNLRVSVFS